MNTTEVAGPCGSPLPEGLGAVLTYEDQGGPGSHGQTLGADGRGWFSVLFYGTPDDAHRAAGEYMRTLRAAGRRIKSECVVTNEDSYSGPNVRAVMVGALQKLERRRQTLKANDDQESTDRERGHQQPQAGGAGLAKRRCDA